MLNIVVVNCDDRLVEYEWKSKEEFVKDMESENENIPILDDFLAEVNTEDEKLQKWWEESIYNRVCDLLEICKEK